MAVDPIRIDGLRDLQAALRNIDGQAQKQLRVVLNDTAELVVRSARRKVPTGSGAAAKSVKVRSSQREARVVAGGRRAPYYPWLDFGGKVGRRRSVSRAYRNEGRYLYPAYSRHRRVILATLEKGVVDLARKQGLAVG